jgi:hypothetical protein
VPDKKRRQRAHVPDEVALATKPAPGTAILTGAARADVPFAWVAADEASDAVKLSSCAGKFAGGVGEGCGFVVVLAGDQAVVEAAEEPAEQVALGGGVPVSVGSAAVLVAADAG